VPAFRNQRRVRHSAAEMFALVADVERYPEFVPLCRALKVRRREQGAAGFETLIADMEIGYKAIRERFTSRVALDPAGMKIRVEYVDGPFSQLENIWNFRDAPDGGGSKVEFFIAYEFRSRLLAVLMGSMFDAAFHKFSAAFEARADEIYGRAPA
jgi:coenzyme Q-binding protein COQ10